MTTKTHTQWNAHLYDDKHGFVSKYGEDLVDLLNPQQGERILDLGCGTGYLANYIAQTGARITGIDNATAMIERAKAAYPDLDFQVLSATDFHFDKPFDAIFSNAALHWVLDKDSAIDCISRNLRPGGRLVLEIQSMALSDRKSTRLNSSHQIISYAVFCLKKKKNKESPLGDTFLHRLI